MVLHYCLAVNKQRDAHSRLKNSVTGAAGLLVDGVGGHTKRKSVIFRISAIKHLFVVVADRSPGHGRLSVYTLTGQGSAPHLREITRLM